MNGVVRKRLLLMTANVGSLFEEGQRLQESWLDVISERVRKEDADFVVIHMQETGGKRYVECSGQVPILINHLSDHLKSQYTVCRAYLDLNYTSPAYTALGSIFFIHKDAVHAVEQYDFIRRSFISLSKEEAMEIRIDGLENENHLVKTKFPKHFWPAMKWGRKGYMQTRWRIRGRICDFINLHLFHDESNLALIHENPSLYSSNRKRALDYVLEQCVLEGDGKKIFKFFFGDFNFRLDPQSFLNRLTECAEPHSMDDMAQHGSQDLLKDPATLRAKELLGAPDLRRTVSAIEFRREDGEASENCVLRIEKKRFDYFNHVKLLDWQSYMEDDKEVYNFPELHELSIRFPPTYPWSEDPLDAGVFMKTRAPAWCDRVLMNDAAFKHLEPSTAIYEIIGRQQCMGDHKPVLLAIDLPV